ncbi:hypothetical protein [Emticicia sp. C21]|uniref:hypothetical protein n=1 Tax=Emticicia sp. C21 TaxID=2302915 RepID=UPI000E346FB3|nr:hypothetical protein [Emticicia sp. C21]RFS16990.1 hypothetical protein D0T08_09950 [Emticicia sp. C21]
MMNKLKLIIAGAGILGIVAATLWLQHAFKKLKERDQFEKQNKALQQTNKVLVDSLQLHKEWLAKALIDTKNATELYTLTKGMTASFQSVIKVMRDSVISINHDRATLEARVLELEKDLVSARKKRKFL